MLDIVEFGDSPTTYKKVEIGSIKTATRVKMGVPQEIRLFTKTQRRLIIQAVAEKPDNMTIVDVLNEYEVHPAVFYSWVRNQNKQKETKFVEPTIEKEVTDYKIVTGRTPEDLTDNVRGLIKNGWKLVGSHTVVCTNTTERFSGSQNTGSHSSFEYCQTMVFDLF